MKKVLIAILLAFFVVSNANANNYYLKFGTGFSLGIVDVEEKFSYQGYIYEDSYDLTENDFPVFSIGIGREVNNFDYSLNLKTKKFDTGLDNIKVKTLSFDINYLFRHNTTLTPYLGIGLNANKFKTTSDGYDLGKKNTVSFSYRIGARKNLNEKLMLDFNIEHFTKTDCFRKYGISGEYQDITANLSLLFKF